jgi:ribulose-phosphate 3-epimerase
MAILAPSILGADFSKLAEEIKSAEAAGIDFYHLDIMDGHFVPNISFGPGVVRTIDKLTDSFLDVHLMLTNPESFFEPFAKAGADAITFHVGVHPDPTPHAKAIKQLGLEAGLSLNPDVEFSAAEKYLEQFDLLLLMSVYPGFGGQSFIEAVLPKIETARKFIDAHGLKTRISVDGGVDSSNCARVFSAGADILVMGSAFFGAADRIALTNQVKGLTR